MENTKQQRSDEVPGLAYPDGASTLSGPVYGDGPLTFAEYQKVTARTAIYPQATNGHALVDNQGRPVSLRDVEEALDYLVLGLASEVGEVCSALKKYKRGDLTQADLTTKLTEELGDVLWYTFRLCAELGFELGCGDRNAEIIARINTDKLNARKNSGVLSDYVRAMQDVGPEFQRAFANFKGKDTHGAPKFNTIVDKPTSTGD